MRPMSVRNTSEEPDTVRTDSATEARPDPWPGSAPLSRWRTNGFAARFSAALRAGRSSCRSKVRAAWAMEIAPTATSTLSTMSAWSRKNCRASVMPCRGEVRGATPRGSHWSAPM